MSFALTTASTQLRDSRFIALRERLAPWFEQSPPGPACPDVVDLLSLYQEWDVTASACRSLEAHVEGCADRNPRLAGKSRESQSG